MSLFGIPGVPFSHARALRCSFFLAMTSVSAPPVPLRTVTLSDLQHEGRVYDMLLNVVNLVDRRPSQVSTPREWLFQKQVEEALFAGLV